MHFITTQSFELILRSSENRSESAVQALLKYQHAGSSANYQSKDINLTNTNKYYGNNSKFVSFLHFGRKGAEKYCHAFTKVPFCFSHKHRHCLCLFSGGLGDRILNIPIFGEAVGSASAWCHVGVLHQHHPYVPWTSWRRILSTSAL